MSELSERMLAATSKPRLEPAVLALEDGTVFAGRSCGARGEACGELCFNTSLEGYLEVVTDPSYAGQIVTMTYPQIGNYGVSLGDVQAPHPALRGLVVRDMCHTPSSWRCEESLPAYLEREGVVAIEGIDTRALVRHLRDHGAMRAVISTTCTDPGALVEKARASEPIVGVNLAKGVSCEEAYRFAARDIVAGKSFALTDPIPARYRVVAYDCGVKRSILEGLARVGCELEVVPWDTPAEDVLAANPDGVFLSNGPGDPDAVTATFEQAEKLLGRVPVFGICLGHQMICLAAGGRMEKMRFGHHGGNHPIVNLRTNRVEIAAQNHGFCLDFASLGPLVPELSGGEAEHAGDLRAWHERGVAPVVANDRYGRIQLTHVNLNDGTVEGISFLDIPAFSVQYHPEASPGPTDSHYLFTAFARLMDGRVDYLDIDIVQDRLGEWRF